MNALGRLFLSLLLFVGILAPARAAAPVRLGTVVIDAGHGGHDSGCVSKDGETTEKSLTLDLATRFAEQIRAAWPEVKVILTREDDTYVTLSGRADIANNAGADLFISIHINAAPSGTTANGYSIHCLGQSSREGNDLFGKNLELCKRENSVIKLEDDYETKYQGFDPSDPASYIFFSLMQNANLSLSLAFADDVNTALGSGPFRRSRGVSQDPFWVLWRTTMPAVLIECGFISNPEDLKTLRDEAERAKIAYALLRALAVYKNRLEGGVGDPAIPPMPAEATKSAEPSATAPADSTKTSQPTVAANASEQTPDPVTVLYGTQVVATPRVLSPDDKFFRGYKPTAVKGEKLIRYVIGTSTKLSEAKKIHEKIEENFKDSFMVKIEGNSVVRIK